MVSSLKFNTPSQVRSLKKVPDSLIYETIDGQPFYRKGYKLVLRKLKTKEEIMGVSKIQANLISYILRQLFRFLNEDEYYIHSNEAGVHLGKNDNLAGDILIFDKQVLTPDLINDNYAEVPPVINIEVDIKVELDNDDTFDYMHRKTQKMLQFGTKKMIWVLKKTKTIIVAEPNEPWQILDWSNDIEILRGVTFNIAAYLKKEGIDLDKVEDKPKP
jgi:Uma2 family endonuclease